jgi:hypothetical protein
MKLFLSMMVLLATNAFAQGEPNIQEIVKKESEMMDKRIVILQAQKKCVLAAKKIEDFKTCGENSRTENEKLMGGPNGKRMPPPPGQGGAGFQPGQGPGGQAPGQGQPQPKK